MSTAAAGSPASRQQKDPRPLQEQHERELADLASRARGKGRGPRRPGRLLGYAKAASLLLLLGVYSNVSQMALSPVYGSIPSAIWHRQLLMTGCFVGWAANLALGRLLPVKTAALIPLVAAYVPLLQTYLFRCSSMLGPKWGPLLTEALTLFPLAVLTAASVADLLDGARLDRLPAAVSDAVPGLASWGLLKFAEQLAAEQLQARVGSLIIYTRLGLELLLAGAYALTAPSVLLFYALPALVHSLMLNPHLPSAAATAGLAHSLRSQGWHLLDRRESVTGYISVLENMQRGFRVMRCDHSLLGGDWVHARGLASEPIYGVFVMLEAVRLVERAEPVPDEEAHALVIGLGVGTTPSALVTHGIQTTIVEIDPVVYDFAVKYFDLKENSPPVLEDAVGYATALAKTAPASFDYIVHDVFTGGAEPVELFTLDFIRELAALLKPEGVIAISNGQNYAGDIALPPPQIIFQTIRAVFPTCRVFRETAAAPASSPSPASDFTNMVIFCTKTTSPLRFRPPTEADLLQSSGRLEFLPLAHEMPQQQLLADPPAPLLSRNNTAAVARWHQRSALGHWAIMRSTLPAAVWELW